jgi:hypothetical protein
MEPMIVAEMETEHYSWLALGRDEAEAREALVATLIAHARQCGNEGSWCFDGMDPDPVAALEYYGALLELGRRPRPVTATADVDTVERMRREMS